MIKRIGNSPRKKLPRSKVMELSTPSLQPGWLRPPFG